MAKLKVLVAFGAGYVLGARAGRERYEQIASKAQETWRSPRVQKTAAQAQDAIADKAAQAAGAVTETVRDKVSGGGSSTDGATT